MYRAVALDKLTLPLGGMCVNPEVARRLPFDLACRYQALPVAEDDGHLTVAMAHPNDMEARQAILAALPPSGPRSAATYPATPACATGMAPEQRQHPAPEQHRHIAGAQGPTEVNTGGMSVYLVRGEPVAIDSLLADVWPGLARRALHLLVVAGSQGQAGVRDYAHALGSLLGAESISTASTDAAAPSADTPENGPNPIRKLLLVVQGGDDPSGPACLAWAVRLARTNDAAVTILAVVPPGPSQSLLGDEDDLATLLTTSDTVVGQAAQHLVQAGIVATLRLRQGSLAHQLHREVIETDYDLVLVGSKPIPAIGSCGASVGARNKQEQKSDGEKGD